MQDVSNGQERVRTWPRKRKPSLLPKTRENMDKFAQAQMATKFMAPEILGNATVATQGTPLLPRDILTMMLYNRMMAFQFSDGKWRHPLPFRTDVSESLDALGNQEGMTLRRGPQFWEASTPTQLGKAGVIFRDPGTQVIGPANAFAPYIWSAPVTSQGPFWDAAHPTDITLPWDGWYAAVWTVDAVSSGAGNGYRSTAFGFQSGEVFRTNNRLGKTGSANYNWTAGLFLASAGDVLQTLVLADAVNMQWRTGELTVLFL